MKYLFTSTFWDLFNNSMNNHSSAYLNEIYISFQILGETSHFAEERQFTYAQFLLHTLILHILIHCSFTFNTFIKYSCLLPKLRFPREHESHNATFDDFSTRCTFSETQLFRHRCVIFHNHKASPILIKRSQRHYTA